MKLVEITGQNCLYARARKKGKRADRQVGTIQVNALVGGAVLAIIYRLAGASDSGDQGSSYYLNVDVEKNLPKDNMDLVKVRIFSEKGQFFSSG